MLLNQDKNLSHHELLVYYLYVRLLSFIWVVLFGYDSVFSFLLDVADSLLKYGFCLFFSYSFWQYFFLDFCGSLCGNRGAGDFSFLSLTVLFGNKGFKRLVLRNSRVLLDTRKFGMVSHRNPREAFEDVFKENNILRWF
ncbi:uncharacterized protein OCT59_028355 [Rhizophagus irregularis]|uniref:uncharacterized protein n=1 Tax=Rhizophagus irregularis TaxID=588596 RepID=UPI003329026E|nr:hypothetical protein OCT59_028355 [Rhizophagus irregularis]